MLRGLGGELLAPFCAFGQHGPNEYHARHENHLNKRVCALTADSGTRLRACLRAIRLNNLLVPTMLRNIVIPVFPDLLGGLSLKRDGNDTPIEQGVGAKGHETRQHFEVLRRNEQLGIEPKGSWATALREIRKRDPERAKKLNLPEVAQLHNYAAARSTASLSVSPGRGAQLARLDRGAPVASPRNCRARP